MRDLLLFGNDANALAAVKSLVGDLSLEGEALDLGQIQVLHLGQLADLLQGIFKCDFGVLSHVTDISYELGLVFRYELGVLVPELEAFVELDLGDHV